ncbi:PaaI family thioesterase [Azospirillum argentinense]|uniref:PaaI family thioesterase n=1 Tax=Azospirillum brasilense TaxID=192 RepID=A0A4D8R8X9_AZOBR|nr:PaaI family thioesterase [Azospirillum brasilense]NUB23996.1 hotdog fold thioesterase [Azospirillum brasilense]NUB33978.1 hotdog fold thioesterase [Azospirillum brasilense]QCO19508.1 PaaI family thioesterase [Azospirillum brasilense]
MNLDHHNNAFLTMIGLTLSRWEPGMAEFDLVVDHRHTNRQGILQGGVLATMLDAACGYAGLHDGTGVAEGVGEGQAVTLSLMVNYLARVEGGRLRAVGTVTGGGRRIYFANGVVHAGDGSVVATAQGSFKRMAPR